MHKYRARLQPVFVLILFISIFGLTTIFATRNEPAAAQSSSNQSYTNPNYCHVTIHIQGSGSVQFIDNHFKQALEKDSTNELLLNCNEDVQLIAISEPGWYFAGWQGDSIDDIDGPVISISDLTEVTAVFIKRDLHYEPLDAPYYDRSGRLLTAIPQFEPMWRSLAGIENADSSPPTIEIWYGDKQFFGQIGNPQQYINILGNISDPDNDLLTLEYTLNGGASTPLSFGGDGSTGDGRRLYAQGDFNIDIDKASLNSGANQIFITATDSLNNQANASVIVNFVTGTTWPLPFNVDWEKTSSVQEKLQVVDGYWTSSAVGVRPDTTGYDRLLAIGDINWTDYEITVPVTIHGFNEAGFEGFNTAPALGIIMHWQGHTDDPIACGQPKCGWLPVGMASWYAWDTDRSGNGQASMWVRNNNQTYDTSGLSLAIDTTYYWKIRVDSSQGTYGTYNMKIWPAGSLEPDAWLISKAGTSQSLSSGSALLLAHHVDVTFGDILVTPISEDSTPTPTQSGSCSPAPGNILANAGFESGTSNWTFFTNGKGNFTDAEPAYQCNKAARLMLDEVGTNIQLYQSNFVLKANTNYRLSFAAYSNTAHDLRVYLQQHKSPYNNYGLKSNSVNLTDSWQTHTIDFTTEGFSGTTSDTRLRFWFPRLARDGDIYWIDDVRLEEIGGASTETPTATSTPAAATNTPTPTATTPSGATATATTSATASATATSSGSCTLNPDNILTNPGFESGKNNWSFYTNGIGAFVDTTPAFECDKAGRISLNKVGSNMQLYQIGFPLKANTNYKLSFAAYSNTGHDLRVFLQKHTSPYTSYGIKNLNFNLGTSWQTYSKEFTTSGFSGSTSGTRLRFGFVGPAVDGDIYWIDDVRLEEIGGSPSTPNPTATSASQPTSTPTPGSGGGGGKNELLVYDWNTPVTVSQRGFPRDKPPRAKANGDWTKPNNYAGGTLFFRAEIRNQPVAQNMQLQFCFWQEKNGNNHGLESCSPKKSVRGTSGNVETWSLPVKDLWKKGGKSIEWWRPRYVNGVAIKNSAGKPVSNFNGWNWNGEDPKKWYPLDMRFTVVVVAKGASFSGWGNYTN